MFFFFNGTATTEISTYGHPLSRPHALPISRRWPARERPRRALPSSCASVPPGVSPRLLKRARPPSPRWRLSRSKRRNPRSPGHSSHPIRHDGRDSTSPNRNWGWLWVRWADNHPQNGRSGSAQGDGGADEIEEVVAFVVDDDEGGRSEERRVGKE